MFRVMAVSLAILVGPPPFVSCDFKKMTINVPCAMILSAPFNLEKKSAISLPTLMCVLLLSVGISSSEVIPHRFVEC